MKAKILCKGFSSPEDKRHYIPHKTPFSMTHQENRTH